LIFQEKILFDGSQEVMQIRVPSLAIYKRLFREAKESFPDLTYYDVDIPLTIRYAAEHNVFMMVCCKVTAEEDGNIISMRAVDTPEGLEPRLPRLRILSLRPDTDPSHESPKYLISKFGRSHMRPLSVNYGEAQFAVTE
jgi:hypothetical protein